MFLIDDILLAPARGFMSICQRVYEAAQQDLKDQEKAVLAELSELHQLLEAGRISDEDFNTRESALLDHLDAAQNAIARGTTGDEQE